MSALNLADCRVLVTGGHGFLGRAVCRQLRHKGVEQVLSPRSAEFDLTRQADAERLVTETQPNLILHLAAEVGGIGANRRNPGRYFYANMAMGLNLIEAARQQSNELAKFVQVGTICAYPKHTSVPFQESELWNGYPEETNAPYGVAKKALLTMLQGYREQHDFPGIYLLPVNLYGPGDNFDLQDSHVVPAMIRKFVAARDDRRSEVQLWGTGAATREFLYVEDCAAGILQAAERYDAGDPINLGTGVEISIRSLAEKIAAMVGYEGSVVWDSSKPDGQPRRCLDTTRAEREFGWLAETSLDEGLAATIDWWSRQSTKTATC